MILDPVTFILVLKKCPGEDEEKWPFIVWLEIATSILLRSNNHDISKELCYRINSMSGDILKHIANLNIQADDNRDIKYLYITIVNFYKWLNDNIENTQENNDNNFELKHENSTLEKEKINKEINNDIKNIKTDITCLQYDRFE